MNRPLAILFDFGDTLLRAQRYDTAAGTRRIMQMARNPRGWTDEQVEAAARNVRMDFDARRAASMLEISVQTFQRLLYEPLGIEFDATAAEVEMAFWDAAELWTPMPGVHQALEALRDLDLPLAIVSNCSSSGRTLEHELAKHRLAGFFRFVMASSDYGVRKPHPGLFSAAAGKLGLEAKDIWFVGDRLEFDVTGARAAGMPAVWFNWQKAERGSITPDCEIQSLADLAERVETLRRSALA